MINIGMWNELTVLRQKDFGIYLGEKEPERASLWNGRGDTSSVFKETEVLLPAKQHVSTGNSRRPGQKPSPGRAEAQGHIPLGAGSHQRRRRTGIGKADNTGEIVQWEPANLCLLPFHHNILPIQREIGVL